MSLFRSIWFLPFLGIFCAFSTLGQVCDFSYKKVLTLDGNQIAGSGQLQDFPVLVSLTDNQLRTVPNGGRVQSSSGYDIAFQDENGNELDHQIESYDASSGHIEMWVSVPSLPSGSDFDIHMYYGNVAVVSDPSSSATWDSDFRGVWHMHDDFLDGSSNGNDGTNFSSADVDGQVGDAQQFVNAGDRVEFPDDNSLDLSNFTLEAWVYPTQIQSSWQPIVCKQNTGGGERNYGLFILGNTMRVHYSFQQSNCASWQSQTSTGSMNLNQWNHIAMTYDGSTYSFYLNGTLDRTQSLTSTVCNNTYPIKVGDEISAYLDYKGNVDEIRVSSTARTLGWFTTQFNNVDDPGAFISVGSEISAPFEAVAGLDLSVGTLNQAYCIRSGQDVTWSDLSSGMITSAAGVVKTGANGWNGGAAISDTVGDDMFIETVAKETNTYRMFGLNDVNTSASYTDIDYAFYMVSGGSLRIYESGSNIGTFGTYGAGDTLRIAAESGSIIYYLNSNVVYTSLVSPVFPMIGDASVYTTGGTVEDVKVGYGLDGTFSVTSQNGGTGPTYQWKLNGSNVGAGATTYNNSALVDGDEVWCEMTTDVVGCNNSTINSDTITVETSFTAIGNAIISADPPVSACFVTEEDANWTDVMSSVSATPGNLTKTGSNGWNGGAATYSSVDNLGYVETVIAETNLRRMFGLSQSNTNANYTSIEYAFYPSNNSVLYIYESGAYRGAFGNYVTGDTLEVGVESNQVVYKRNGVIVYTSGVAPTLPMIVDVSLYDNGSTLQEVKVVRSTDGDFTAAIAGAGSSPSYQWKLNGADVGSNSVSYSNAALSEGDVVSCEVTPDYSGCDASVRYSNSLTIVQKSTPSITFAASADGSTSSCLNSLQAVTWTDVTTNINVQGNGLLKYGGGWNGGAASVSTLGDNSFVMSVVGETNTARMFGLSQSNTDANYTTIEYAFYMNTNGLAYVYESGAYRGVFGAYANGDTAKVAIENGEVNYYLNSSLLYSSAVAPSLPLIVDVSLNSGNSTLQEVKIGRGTQGDFTATATGAGSSPTYQWYLNGAPVGTNSTTYSNGALVDGDDVHCELTPDIAGCATSAISSKTIAISEEASASIDFGVTIDAAASSCMTAVEEVSWVDLSGTVSPTGNDLVRFASSSWDGGAASVGTLNDNGYVTTIVDETNTYRTFGLSNVNTDDHYNTIDFCFYLHSNGTLRIYENGSYRGAYGNYNTGDTLKIEVLDDEVYYLNNSTELYVSTITPTLPLLVDVSIYSQYGTLKDVIIRKGFDGEFTANATGAGASPTYQWKLNGANVGSNSSTYTNTGLVEDDSVTCELTPDLPGCSVSALTTNYIVVGELNVNDVTLNIGAVPVGVSCIAAVEEVVWDNESQNVAIVGNSISKLTSNSWNGGASSISKVDDNGRAEMVVAETNLYKAFGLSNADTDYNFNTIEYCMYLHQNGYIYIYESGTNRGTFGLYATNDTLAVGVDNGNVVYYRNDVAIYNSGVSPSLPLLVDVSLYSIGASIPNVTIRNGTDGDFLATTSGAGASPTYQWKLNGANVGSNSYSYSNSSITSGDLVTCELTPDVSGCATTVLTSNQITIDQESSSNLSFSILVDNASASCLSAHEEVEWVDVTAFVTTTNNDLTKTGGSGWTQGAASTATVDDNQYMQTIVGETNTSRMIGLSNTNPDANYTTIDYALYLINNATVRVYESGSNRGTFGSYAIGDTMKVSIEGGAVVYYRNSTLLYTSSVVPTLPMIVDVSMSTNGATLQQTEIVRGTDGDFTASVQNAGASPTYQWTLNGANVGSNSPNYSNASLSDGDVVGCELTADLAGCGSNQLVAAEHTIRDNPSATIDFYIEVSPVSASCLVANEDVSWTDLAGNLSVTGNSLVKTGTSGWNGGAASLGSVGDDSEVSTIVAETNTYRMIGLSTVNDDAHYNTIDYALYLSVGGAVNIYENGSSRGGFGSYSTGDTARVAVVDNEVKYYLNSNLLYTSLIAPTLPMVVDLSIYSQNGTLNDVKLKKGFEGTFSAAGSNLGASPTYQWKLNGGNVGTNSSSYVNTSVVATDVITCEVTPDVSGCASTNLQSNEIEVSEIEVSNIELTVSVDPLTSSCLVAEEEVVWTDTTIYVLTTGNSISKTSSNSWNGGAASTSGVQNNGYAQAVLNETNTYRAFGLSNTNTGDNYQSIQYCFYIYNNGTIRIYESGTYRGSFGNYSSGDTLKVGVEDNVVKYYRNSTELYESGVSPTLPLLVDISLYSVGATLQDVEIINGTDGDFIATATNAGPSPTYQWKLNGGNVGINSATYSNASVVDGDVITCEVVPDVGGCASTIVYGNNVTIREEASPVIDFYISPGPTTASCLNSYQDVAWTDLTSNMTALGHDLTKIGSGWNGGAASFTTVGENAWVQTVIAETNTARMIGLSSTNTDANYNTIDYAFYPNTNGILYIYESGSYIGSFGSYSSGDTLRVAVESGEIKYYNGQTLIYTSLTSPSLPLLVDLSLNTNGSTLQDVVIVRGSDGVFNATAVNAGASPSYQWKLNGGNVGSNSATYTNTSIGNSDVVTCELTPDIGGCSTNPITSNSVEIQEETSLSLQFAVSIDAAASSCISGLEDATFTDITTNLTATGNDLIKTATTGWNGGAASLESVGENGFVRTIANETTTYRMIGLSQSNTNANYNTIEYALYMRVGASLYIYESGISRGSFGTYATGDSLEIRIESGVVNYYRNDILIYASTVSPSLPMIVDLSIYTIGGTLEGVEIGQGTAGDFTAVASNAGPSPTYQWKLNGANVGSNSATYSNGSLVDGDVISCEMIPDIGGCQTELFVSNPVNISELPSADITYSISSDEATASCVSSSEQAAWTDVTINLTPNGNDFTKVGNGWNGGAASLNTVGEGSYMQTIVNETNTSRMIGLSNSNADANYTTIEYAIYLINNGTIQIYESGSNIGSYGSYSSGDTMRVAVENGDVTYYHNGNLFYTSLSAPTLPLLIDFSLNSTNATVEDVTIGRTTSGIFTATSTGTGSNPSYQWKLNGVNVGSNSATYTNSGIVDGDVVYCELTPDLSGCNAVTLSSNTVTIAEEPSFNLDFHITGSGSTGCFVTEEEVTWTNFAGNMINVDNDLTKVGTNAWNTGVASLNEVEDESFAFTIVNETNAYRAFGLSTIDSDVNYTSIDYCFYLYNNGTLRIYENGVNRGNYGSYSSGDTLKVGVEGGEVFYYNGQTLLYSSTVSPSLPMIVDASLYSTNATLESVTVGKDNDGVFSAVALSAGSSPTYQWKLNGGNVGSNSTTYTNMALNAGDILTCELTPDLGGCSASTLFSNDIEVMLGTSTTWLGANTSWTDPSNWNNGVPNVGLSAVVPNGVSNYPVISSNVEVQNLTVDAGGSLEIAGSNELEINGNLDLQGDIIGNQSHVTMNDGCGAGAATLNLGSNSSFYNMTIDNSNGVTLSGATAGIQGSFEVVDGVVTTGGLLKLESDAVNSGRIGEIGSGDIVGDVTMERFLHQSQRQWRYLATPFTNTTVAHWQNDFPVTGTFTGASTGPGLSNNYSMFWYNEVSGGTQVLSDYTVYPVSSNTEVIQSGRGYAVYVRPEVDTTMTNSGTIQQGLVNYGVTYTATGTADGWGWNLIGNPYPSQIDWNSASGWGKTNIDNAVYFTDNENGLNVSYVNGISVPFGECNGVIAPHQAYWVHVSGSGGVLTSNEQVKTNGSHRLYREELRQTMYLSLSSSSGEQAQSVLYLDAMATDALDKDLDALALFDDALALSTLDHENQEYVIQGIRPEHSSDRYLPLVIRNHEGGQYNLSIDMYSWSDVKVELFDAESGESIEMADGVAIPLEVESEFDAYHRYVLKIVGEGELDLSEFNIEAFPNPTTHALNFVIPADVLIGGALIDVRDNLGQSVIAEQVDSEYFVLETSDLSPGVYHYNVVTEHGVFSGSFIKAE